MEEPKLRFIRKPEVKLRTGLKNTALWRAMKYEGFPSSIKLSTPTKPHNAFGKGRYCGAVAWVESEVDEWIKSRIAKRAE